VNAVLGGNVGNSFPIRWRMGVFYFLVWLQKHLALSRDEPWSRNEMRHVADVARRCIVTQIAWAIAARCSLCSYELRDNFNASIRRTGT